MILFFIFVQFIWDSPIYISGSRPHYMYFASEISFPTAMLLTRAELALYFGYREWSFPTILWSVLCTMYCDVRSRVHEDFTDLTVLKTMCRERVTCTDKWKNNDNT